MYFDSHRLHVLIECWFCSRTNRQKLVIRQTGSTRTKFQLVPAEPAVFHYVYTWPVDGCIITASFTTQYIGSMWSDKWLLYQRWHAELPNFSIWGWIFSQAPFGNNWRTVRYFLYVSQLISVYWFELKISLSVQFTFLFLHMIVCQHIWFLAVIDSEILRYLISKCNLILYNWISVCCTLHLGLRQFW